MKVIKFAQFFAGTFSIYCYDCVSATLEQCQKGIDLEYTECFEPINYDKREYGSQVACVKANDVGQYVNILLNKNLFNLCFILWILCCVWLILVNGTEKIFRKCGIANGPEDSCVKIKNISTTMECITCLEDFCNSANNLKLQINAVGLITLLYAFYVMSSA